MVMEKKLKTRNWYSWEKKVPRDSPWSQACGWLCWEAVTEHVGVKLGVTVW